MDSTSAPPATFETALARLEAIVESMESGEVTLAELLSRFEEGSQLLKMCEDRLKEAELKIELLKKQRDGTTVLAPFENERATPEGDDSSRRQSFPS